MKLGRIAAVFLSLCFSASAQIGGGIGGGGGEGGGGVPVDARNVTNIVNMSSWELDMDFVDSTNTNQQGRIDNLQYLRGGPLGDSVEYDDCRVLTVSAYWASGPCPNPSVECDYVFVRQPFYDPNTGEGWTVLIEDVLDDGPPAGQCQIGPCGVTYDFPVWLSTDGALMIVPNASPILPSGNPGLVQWIIQDFVPPDIYSNNGIVQGLTAYWAESGSEIPGKVGGEWCPINLGGSVDFFEDSPAVPQTDNLSLEYVANASELPQAKEIVVESNLKMANNAGIWLQNGFRNRWPEVAGLTDVSLGIPQGEDVLTYDSEKSVWTNKASASSNLRPAPNSSQVSLPITATATDATPITMVADGSGSLAIPTDSMWVFEAQVGVENGSAESAAYLFRGAIENSGGNTVLRSGVVDTLYEHTTSMDIQLSADNVANELAISVLGVSGQANKFSGWITYTEVVAELQPTQVSSYFITEQNVNTSTEINEFLGWYSLAFVGPLSTCISYTNVYGHNLWVTINFQNALLEDGLNQGSFPALITPLFVPPLPDCFAAIPDGTVFNQYTAGATGNAVLNEQGLPPSQGGQSTFYCISDLNNGPTPPSWVGEYQYAGQAPSVPPFPNAFGPTYQRYDEETDTHWMLYSDPIPALWYIENTEKTVQLTSSGLGGFPEDHTYNYTVGSGPEVGVATQGECAGP